MPKPKIITLYLFAFTQYLYPPITLKNHDWVAWYEGDEERMWWAGWGETEAEAIKDLEENYGEGE